MKLKFYSLLVASLLSVAGSVSAQNDYGIPEEIKDGNILHCFDWKLNDIKNALPDIAEAGFGAVQISPVQCSAQSGYNWSNLYRPYDFTFIQNGLGNATQLQTLCEEAAKYGIKIVVDVVFNHVDNSGFHSSWWDQNGRLRSTTNKVTNYNDRYSVTHDRIGDYPEVNSESTEVIARAKAYIEELKGYGVKGVRFDAAKHIALPSEGCNFWSEVTSVDGMFYYGEILGSPGGSSANNLMKEYTDYMFVTDDEYSKRVRSNAGVPSASGNWSEKGIDPYKIVYWAESHDEYSNDPNYGGVSKNVSQAVLDRAYAMVGSRDKGIALYFSRPSNKNFGSILVGQKGSTHFTESTVAEVNKFKNAMVGREEYFSKGSGAASIIRKGGGAVIVKQSGAGNVSVPNGDGFCPSGTYVDRISGNVFTVTPETISGTAGESGIVVIYDSNDDTGIDDIVDDELNPADAKWFTIQGVQVSAPTERGIYIAVYPNGTSRKLVIR